MDFRFLQKTWVEIYAVNTGQKLLDSAKKSTTDAIKTASKREIQKIAEATGDLIGDKIADKIISVSKKPKNPQNNKANDETETPTERYISRLV